MTIKNYLNNKIIELENEYPNNETIQNFDIVYTSNNLNVSECLNLESYEDEKGIMLKWNDEINDELKILINGILLDYVENCI